MNNKEKFLNAVDAFCNEIGGKNKVSARDWVSIKEFLADYKKTADFGEEAQIPVWLASAIQVLEIEVSRSEPYREASDEMTEFENEFEDVVIGFYDEWHNAWERRR